MAYVGVKPAGISSASQVETNLLDVDNITIDGNTISSTDTNGDIMLDPDGTGKVSISGALHIDSGSDNANTLLLSDGAADNNIVDGFVTCRHHSSSEEPVHMIQGRATSSENIVLIGGTHNNTTYNTATSIKFFTAANSTTTTPSERMHIDSSGNVGIGTASPGYPMELASSSGAGTQFGITYVPNSVTLLLRAGGGDVNVGSVGSHPLLLKTGNTERARIDTSGRVLAGKTSSGYTTDGVMLSNAGNNYSRTSGTVIDVNRNGSNGNAIVFYKVGTAVGSITVTGSSTAFNTSSDYRLKENVADMTGAIDRVKALAPKRFNFIADDSVTVDGFLAHEAQAVVPEAVTGTHNEVDEDGIPVMQAIDQSKLVPLLTGALREAIAKIEVLETSNADLTARIEALETA